MKQLMGWEKKKEKESHKPNVKKKLSKPKNEALSELRAYQKKSVKFVCRTRVERVWFRKTNEKK